MTLSLIVLSLCENREKIHQSEKFMQVKLFIKDLLIIKLINQLFKHQETP